uniref:Sex-determining region Y protein n=1 Tax=Heterorhabditis bacteriophora TaxID=37862 RepID=A0A1I7X632_HETBA
MLLPWSHEFTAAEEVILLNSMTTLSTLPLPTAPPSLTTWTTACEVGKHSPEPEGSNETTPTIYEISAEENSPSAVDKNIQRIKRPMNAFMVWSQMRRAEISSKCSKIHNSHISKVLGMEWRALTEEQKQPYVEKKEDSKMYRSVLKVKKKELMKARELRDDLFREHPNYVYRPRKRKQRIIRTPQSIDEIPVFSPEIPERTTMPSDLTALHLINVPSNPILFNQLFYAQILAQLSQYNRL